MASSFAIPVVVGHPIMTNAIALIPPMSLRIGPDKYRYDYTIIPGIVSAGRPVYRCCRGRDSSPAALHLYFKPSLGLWVSEGFQHEVTDASDIERGGLHSVPSSRSPMPAFRAVGADVIDEGWHEWQCYDGAWCTPSSF